MEEPKDQIQQSPFYSNSKYMLNFPDTYETVGQLLRALERINILSLKTLEEFLSMNVQDQKEVLVCIHSVTRDMIYTKWDPLSEFVCFNEKALAEFEAKFPLFKAIVEHPITSTLIGQVALDKEKETLSEFEIGVDYNLGKRYPISEVERWN